MVVLCAWKAGIERFSHPIIYLQIRTANKHGICYYLDEPNFHTYLAGNHIYPSLYAYLAAYTEADEILIILNPVNRDFTI